MWRPSMTAAPSSWSLHTVGNGASGAVTRDSSRVAGQRETARVPGAVPRDESRVTTEATRCCGTKSLFAGRPKRHNGRHDPLASPVAHASHGDGVPVQCAGRCDRWNKWTPSGQRPVANGTRMVCNQRLHRSGRSGRTPLNASSPAAR
jgi:hypothetical protein